MICHSRVNVLYVVRVYDRMLLLLLVVLVCRHWQRIPMRALILRQYQDHIYRDTKDLTAVYEINHQYLIDSCISVL